MQWPYFFSILCCDTISDDRGVIKWSLNDVCCVLKKNNCILNGVTGMLVISSLLH